MISSFGHDVGHPGLNNRFLVNNQEALAINYNDLSVLENMHSSVTFKTMKSKNCNVLANFTGETFNFIRKLIIEMILETDMSKYFDALGKFRSKFLSVNN